MEEAEGRAFYAVSGTRNSGADAFCFGVAVDAAGAITVGSEWAGRVELVVADGSATQADATDVQVVRIDDGLAAGIQIHSGQDFIDGTASTAPGALTGMGSPIVSGVLGVIESRM